MLSVKKCIYMTSIFNYIQIVYIVALFVNKTKNSKSHFPDVEAQAIRKIPILLNLYLAHLLLLSQK